MKGREKKDIKGSHQWLIEKLEAKFSPFKFFLRRGLVEGANTQIGMMLNPRFCEGKDTAKFPSGK